MRTSDGRRSEVAHHRGVDEGGEPLARKEEVIVVEREGAQRVDGGGEAAHLREMGGHVRGEAGGVGACMLSRRDR